MYAVSVTFEIEPEFITQFMPVMLQQARNSLALESECHRFDVCRNPDDQCHVFLYEIYSDEAAFQRHLDSDHFLDFSSRVADWVISKEAQTWVLVP